MSYSIYIGREPGPPCPTCGHRPGSDEPFEQNITRNVSRIVDRCLVVGGAIAAKTPGFSGARGDYSWCRLHGWSGADLAPILRRAIVCLRDESNELLNLQPSNGWGSIDDVANAFAGLLGACERDPKATCQVHG